MSEPTTLEALDAAKEHIADLNAEIDRLLQGPLSLATTLKILPGDKLLVSGDKVVEIPDPQTRAEINKARKKAGLPALTPFTPEVGGLVTVTGSGAVLENIDVPLAGMTVSVRRLLPDSDLMEVEAGQGAVLVFKGAVADCIKPGSIVQLDRSGSIALRVVPKDRSAHAVETATGVTWADIGGQDEAKAMLQEAIEGPIKHAKLYLAYGKRPMKGLLMSGPPGCGKTLMAKAACAAILEAHNAGDDGRETAFIYVKGPEVLNMWVGNTEAQIRGLFQRAREHKDTHGYPAVIFIDEADAILGKRGGHHASILSSTIVPTFLAEMDGLVDSGAFVLLATNRPDTLDPAVVREGRIDRKVVVGRPALRESAQILSIHLKRTRCSDKIEELAGTAAGELFSDAHKLYNVGLKSKGVHPFHMKHLVSGALLAGVVDQATSLAIQRDSKAGSTKPSGLTTDDMRSAVVQLVRANRNLNHEDDLLSFAEVHGDEIAGVQKLAA